MELSTTAVGGLLIAAILLSVAALVVGVVALVGQRRVKRAYQTFSMGSADDVLTLLQRHIDDVGLLRSDVRALRRFSDELRELARGALSQIGTVRYDAFDDMGGHLSFSTAVLDERGDGVVITAISGRTDTRIYAKPIVGHRSRHHLSEEELEAIERARTRQERRIKAARQAPRSGDGPPEALDAADDGLAEPAAAEPAGPEAAPADPEDRAESAWDAEEHRAAGGLQVPAHRQAGVEAS